MLLSKDRECCTPCELGEALCKAQMSLVGLKESGEVLADLGLLQPHSRQVHPTRAFPFLLGLSHKA